MSDVVTMDKIVALSKRRGFVFPTSEIYGGLGSTYDYGPYGVALRRNIKDAWWRAMVIERDDIVGLDSAILQHPRTWEASGHLAVFTDPLVDCRACKQRFRADQLEDAQCPQKPSVHPGEGPNCDFTEARQFNLMFKTLVGPGGATTGRSSTCARRPRRGCSSTSRTCCRPRAQKPPFGIAQIGKSFRNEITPGNFIFRTREFEQMEMEFFVPPAEAEQWFEYWIDARERWYLELGLSARTSCACAPHDADELSHYSTGTSDIEYLLPDRAGRSSRASRTAATTTSASTREYSGEKLEYFDQATGERYVPHVIEPAAGVDRACSRSSSTPTTRTRSEGEKRTVLRLHPRLAPVKVGGAAAGAKDGQPELAHEVHDLLRPLHAQPSTTRAASIGRRYRRQDEIGTPWAVTIDHQSLEDRTVTVRDRDSLAQDRVAIDALPGFLQDRLAGKE